MDKRVYTWAEVEDMAAAIAAGAKGHGFNSIIAVSRGGLIPAYFVASRLGIKKIHTICLSAYEGIHKGELKLESPMMPVIEKGDKVLVIDDICDTGETLAYIKAAYLYCVIYTATLINKNVIEPPNFYAEVLPLATWAVFPWEAYEESLSR